MKVLKFGGTSVGSVQSLSNVKKIVENDKDQLIVVVSALGGITDQLLKTANIAINGEFEFNFVLVEICCRHLDIIDALVPEQKRLSVKDKIFQMTEQLRHIYREINRLKQISQQSLDRLVSYGERMSSAVIAELLSDAILMDSRAFIKTKSVDGKSILDETQTGHLVHQYFDNLDSRVIVVPGFIASDEVGETTNLGRGGSDFTAAILAAELNASILEIWTDVDGFMTADPRVVPTAKVIESLSYADALSLCNFGAKVVYPPTINPVFQKNIPIIIKNTFNPSAPGTRISDSKMQGDCNCKRIKGLSSTNNNTLFPTVAGSGMQLSTIAIVGENMDNNDVYDEVISALEACSISIMGALRNSTSLSLLLQGKDLGHALNIIHDSLL